MMSSPLVQSPKGCFSIATALDRGHSSPSKRQIPFWRLHAPVRSIISERPPSKASTSRSWRATASPSAPFSIPQQPKGVSETKAGEVYFLPAETDCQGSVIHEQLLLDGNIHIFEHPVVVLMSKFKSGQEFVLFRVGTSIGGKGIEAKSPYYQPYHLLVEDHRASPHLNTQPLKLATGSDCFSKVTYINSQEGQMYEIEASQLRPWMCGSKRITLDQDSVSKLLSSGCNAGVQNFDATEIRYAARTVSQLLRNEWRFSRP